MIRRVLRGLERSAKKGRRQQRGWHISKRGNKRFYKGRGARSLGEVDSKGHFRYNPAKLPVFHVPDLTDCELKPYVAYGTPKLEKVPIPKLADLDLDFSKAEVDLLDIIAPHHKRLRLAKKQAQESLAGGQAPAQIHVGQAQPPNEVDVKVEFK